MKRKKESEGLIFDIGASEGNDSAFYLEKGFQVIAVDADPAAFEHLRVRFKNDIEAGLLLPLNFAAGTRLGEFIQFFAHSEHQGISSTRKRPEVDPDRYSTHVVPTIDWATLRAQAGMPRYVKIDIEGAEEAFLTGMMRDPEIPEFISIECYQFRPCQILFEMGYRRFKLVDQKKGFKLPERQLEGIAVERPDFTHASGPFGLDLFATGDWLDFSTFSTAWQESKPLMKYTWFDCHAWKPN